MPEILHGIHQTVSDEPKHVPCVRGSDIPRKSCSLVVPTAQPKPPPSCRLRARRERRWIGVVPQQPVTATTLAPPRRRRPYGRAFFAPAPFLLRYRCPPSGGGRQKGRADREERRNDRLNGAHCVTRIARAKTLRRPGRIAASPPPVPLTRAQQLCGAARNVETKETRLNRHGQEDVGRCCSSSASSAPSLYFSTPRGLEASALPHPPCPPLCLPSLPPPTEQNWRT